MFTARPRTTLEYAIHHQRVETNLLLHIQHPIRTKIPTVHRSSNLPGSVNGDSPGRKRRIQLHLAVTLQLLTLNFTINCPNPIEQDAAVAASRGFPHTINLHIPYRLFHSYSPPSPIFSLSSSVA
ncbi:hypothetical protein D3C85_1358080 [compost metagenome]